MMRLVALFIVLAALIQLTACGGSGNDGESPELTLSVSVASAKMLRFSWNDVGANHYKLLKNPDGNSGFSQIGGDILTTTEDEEISVHLTDWANASYLVQACDNLGACVDSAPLTVTSQMLEAIGYVKAGDIGSDNYPVDGRSQFGSNIALSADGETLAVAAIGTDLPATESSPGESRRIDAGAVYLYVREEGSWRQQAYIQASNADPDDYFGLALSLSHDGNTLAVGAPFEESSATGVNGNESDNSASWAGAVYLFTRNGGLWNQQAYIKASNSVEDDFFGEQVSLSGSGDVLGVSADEKVYLFRRSGTDWSQEAILTSVDVEEFDGFGEGMELSDDGLTLAVGAPNEGTTDNNAIHAGAVHVYVFDGDAWSKQASVRATNAEDADRFGVAVSLSETGNTLAVGATFEASATTGVNGDSSDNSATHAGAVYLFERQGGSWTETAYIKASNTDPEDLFGKPLTLSGDGSSLLVSAPGEDSVTRGVDGDQTDNSAQLSSGAVYLFRHRDDNWHQQAYIKASNTDEGYIDDYCSIERPLVECWGNDGFGVSLGVSQDGATLAVGAPYENSGDPDNQEDNSVIDSGAVFLY